MFFSELDQQFATLKDSLGSFVPELMVCAAIIIMLGLRLIPRLRLHMAAIVLPICLVALMISALQWLEPGRVVIGGFDLSSLNVFGPVVGNPTSPREMTFSGLIIVDHFTIALRILLLSFTLLVTWLSVLSGIPDEEDSADFYTLLLGGTLGMMLMASANHLLMVFIAVEMASLP